MNDAAPAVGRTISEEQDKGYSVRTDEGDGHEWNPQPAVEANDTLFSVHLQRKPRDRDLVSRGLQPRLDGVQLHATCNISPVQGVQRGRD